MPESSRRRHERIPERLSVNFRPIGEESAGARVSAVTVNMSESGLCLVSPEALSAETHLALELNLEGHEETVMALGRVVWCDRDGEQYRVGICFTWLREQDREPLGVIAEYVQSRIES
jgi:c-di-GMP-binding flagellar brake protein YcgR